MQRKVSCFLPAMSFSGVAQWVLGSWSENQNVNLGGGIESLWVDEGWGDTVGMQPGGALLWSGRQNQSFTLSTHKHCPSLMIPIQKLDDVSLKKGEHEAAFTMPLTREWKCKSIYALPDQEQFLSDTYWALVPDMSGLSPSKGTFLSSQGQNTIQYLCKFQI